MIEKVQADWDDLRQMQQSPTEEALRWLATRRHSRPFGLLVHAIEDPESDSAAQLEPLTTSTASVPGGSPETRALAVWGLIVYLISKVGSTSDSRRRNTLIAAFRLPRRPEITEPWKSSLGDRFRQLMALPGVFGDPPPTTTTPMHKAWKHALSEKLAPILQEHLETLAVDGTGWTQYVDVAQATLATIAREQSDAGEPQDHTVGYRRPSKGAQPVFVDLFITTVFMRGRTVYRRITERLVTAREDNVEWYTARALTGWTGDLANLPVRTLWGCRAEPLVASSGGPALTKLWFPAALRRGEKHYFSSEAIDENLTEERLWVNVEVDHHGIAPGQLLYGCIPISGLTLRIRFDEACLPEACWWYAEQTDRERREMPPDGDPRLLTIADGAAEHTFTERCHPRENYGISILWPSVSIL